MRRRRLHRRRHARPRGPTVPRPSTRAGADAQLAWPGLGAAIRWLDERDGHDVLATMMLIDRLGVVDAQPPGAPEISTWMLEHLAAHLGGADLLATAAVEQKPPPGGSLDRPIADLGVFVEALQAWSVGAILEHRLAQAAAPEDDQLSEMGERLHMGLRWEYDPGEPEREVLRIAPLFGSFDDALIDQFGFSSGQVTGLLPAVNELLLQRLSDDGGAPDGSVAALRANPVEIVTGAARLFAVAAADLHAASTAIGTDVPLDACRRYLETMTVDADRPWPRTALGQLDHHRISPFLPYEGGALLTVGASIAFAPRRQFERALHDMPSIRNAYFAHRGRWLEEHTAALLAGVLRPDLALSDITVGEGDNKLDRDGLVVLDDIAIAVEAKAFQLPPGGERGNIPELEKRYRKHMHKAARQAHDTVNAVLAGTKVSQKGVSGQHHIKVRHAIPLAVTLPDVGTLTPRLARLMPADLANDLIVLSIDDLTWCTEMFRLPAELLHYFVLRQWLGEQSTTVVDEDDWLRLYLAAGPDRLETSVAGWNRPGLDVLARADRTSRRTLPGDGLPYPLHLWPTLLALDQLRPPGWLALSRMLLDESRERLLSLSTALAQADAIARRTNEATSTSVATPHLAAEFVSLPHATLDDATAERRFDHLLGDATQPLRALLVRTCDDPAGWPLAQAWIELDDPPSN